MTLIPKRNKARARKSKPRDERAPARASDGLERADKLLDESRGLSESAKENLDGLEQGIAAISTKASRDHLSDVDVLLDKSKDFSGSAKANLEGVKKDIDAIGREAEARKKLSRP